MNIVESIWKYKCPRCRKGDFFKKPFRMNNPLDMNEVCEHCGQETFPEPGYYFGAMFVSYIWTAFASLAIIAICVWGFGLSINASFAVLIIVSALSYFKVARLSRSLYAHMDMKYDPKYANEPPKSEA